MSASYTRGGMGAGSAGLMGMFQSLKPDRDNGPNKQLRIDFPNGVALSIIWGWGTYCDSGTVEVAVIGKDDEWITQEVALAAFGEMPGDVVDSYCDADRVHGYFVTAQEWAP